MIEKNDKKETKKNKKTKTKKQKNKKRTNKKYRTINTQISTRTYQK